MGLFGKKSEGASILGLESSLQLEIERDELKRRSDANYENLQTLKKELELYSGDGYKAFKSSVLCQEKIRLATLLIEVFDESTESKFRDERLRIRGQYAEVRRLIDRPDELAAEIQRLELERYDILTALNGFDARIKAAKDREG